MQSSSPGSLRILWGAVLTLFVLTSPSGAQLASLPRFRIVLVKAITASPGCAQHASRFLHSLLATGWFRALTPLPAPAALASETGFNGISSCLFARETTVVRTRRCSPRENYSPGPSHSTRFPLLPRSQPGFVAGSLAAALPRSCSPRSHDSAGGNG